MEVRRLKHAAKKNRVARLLFEHFAARDEGGTETTVDSLMAVLQQTAGAVRRAEVVKTLQYLESLGCGKFTPGRHSRPSRMSWAFDLRAVANLALEEGDDRPASASFEPSQHAASEGEGYAVLWAANRAELEGMTESCSWDETVNGRKWAA